MEEMPCKIQGVNYIYKKEVASEGERGEREAPLIPGGFFYLALLFVADASSGLSICDFSSSKVSFKCY